MTPKFKLNPVKQIAFKYNFYLGYFLRNPSHPGQGIDMAVPRTVVTPLPVEMHHADDVCISY